MKMEKYLIDVHLCDVVVEALFFLSFSLLCLVFVFVSFSNQQREQSKKSKIIEISKNYFTIRISRFFNSNFTCCILFNSWCMLKFHFNYPSEEKVYDSDEKNKFQRNTSHIERERAFNTMRDAMTITKLEKNYIFITLKIKYRKKSHQNV